MSFSAPNTAKNIFIIGAGPAGLAASYYFSKLNFNVSVFEALDRVGGLSRSWEWQGFNLDTGPHIFHTNDSSLIAEWSLLFDSLLLPKSFYAGNLRNNTYFDYPLNLTQLSKYSEFQDDARELALRQGQDNHLLACATSFSSYVKALVGDNIANAFFKQYPEKLWGIDTSDMSAEWAPKRVRITEEREPFFGSEYTAIGTTGTGPVMNHLKSLSAANGTSFHLNHKLTHANTCFSCDGSESICSLLFDIGHHIVVDSDDLVFFSIPLPKILRFFDINCNLAFRGTLSLYFDLGKISTKVLPDNYDWIYFQDSSSYINRICIPTDWSKHIDLTNQERTLVAVETAVSHTISDFELQSIISTCQDEVSSFLSQKDLSILSSTSNLERYVYPVITNSDKALLASARDRLSNITNLETLGTGADFKYGDMQVLFLKAKDLASSYLAPFDLSLSKRSFLNRCSPRSLDIVNQSSSSRPLPKIIAELGINHNGSLQNLLDLIHQAAANNSDFIKFQLYNETERIQPDALENKLVEKAQDIEESIWDILSKTCLRIEDLPVLVNTVNKLGKIPMTTVFGTLSLSSALQVGFRHFKVASMDCSNFELHRALVNQISHIDTIYISTGMATMSEITSVLSFYYSHNVKPVLLQCTSSYPAPNNTLHLSNISLFKNLFSDRIKSVGYSDHSQGIDACLYAYLLGADYLEVHVTTDHNQRGPDHILSLTPSQINLLYSQLITVQQMLGIPGKQVNPCEYITWRAQKKGIRSSCHIKQGQSISSSDIEFVSPPLGISSDVFYNNNFIASKDIKPGTVLSDDNLSLTPVPSRLFHI